MRQPFCGCPSSSPGRLPGCKAVKYAFLPLRRQIQPGQVAGQLIRLEHLVHNSGIILHIAHRVAIEDQAGFDCLL